MFFEVWKETDAIELFLLPPCFWHPVIHGHWIYPLAVNLLLYISYGFWTFWLSFFTFKEPFFICATFNLSSLKPSHSHLKFYCLTSPSHCHSPFFLSCTLKFLTTFPSSFFFFFTLHFYSHCALKWFTVDLISISSSVLPFLHPAIHLLPLIVFFYVSLCLHLFSLLVSFLASVSMGPRVPMQGRSICCQCLSLAYPSTSSFTLSQRFQIFLSISVPHLYIPSPYPSPNSPLPLFFPLYSPSPFVLVLPWVQVIEDDASLWLLHGCRRSWGRAALAAGSGGK